MLTELLSQLENFLWSLGLISCSLLTIWLLPKKLAAKLGKHPLILMVLFAVIMFLVLKIFNR